MRSKYRRRFVCLDGVAYYHLVSRSVLRRFLLGEEEKRVFRGLMRRQAAFAGIEIVSYCLMDNHFHILVRVPEKKQWGDEELIRRYRSLYEGRALPLSAIPVDVLARLLKEDGAAGRFWRQRLLDRMNDVSVFVKELKQRFSIWFNKRHGNEGTLWSGPFFSTLVSVEGLLQVAAYIDANPVRGKLCGNAKEFPWSSWGEANRGHEGYRKSYALLLGEKDWGPALKRLSMVHEKMYAGEVGKGLNRSRFVGDEAFVTRCAEVQLRARGNGKGKKKLGRIARRWQDDCWYT